MKLKDGDFYKMRNGATVGPLNWVEEEQEFNCDPMMVDGPMGVKFFGMWKPDGSANFFACDDEQADAYNRMFDIVEEVTL